MQRRSFLKKAAAGLAAGSVAAPAIAQSQPAIQWRLASSFPKSLDTIYGAADIVSKRVAEITENKFQIRVFAAGEIVPGLQVLDAVQNGTVECGHTAPYYYVGKDPAFAFGTAVPFGLNARQQNAWKYYGGGIEALALLFKDYNVIHIPCGNTGAQMGGWYRKEIKTVADLKGMKMRIGGLAGQVLAKLGVVAQQLAGGDIYPALERGTIDAAEWVGPYDDEKLGFNKVAKFYYYPGWWEGGPELSLLINEKKWAELPRHYQSAVEAACAEANVHMLARYDAKNPEALKRLVGSGTQLRGFTRPVMEACEKAAFELYDELSEKSPHWKRIYPAWKKFRDEQYQWFRVAEYGFDSFAYSPRAKPAAAPAKK
ncbi:MAG: putative TRAP-type mannitol/chloroaromatic compound transporter, periplasmic component [Betaproteobacteria bacterium]|nr:putative TRAP-type mannitol/chloroaromatic compound transporter, periplasmic component [Betaproteobacteria bacterium]